MPHFRAGLVFQQTLKGDAQTRSTLDALLALNTIRTNRPLDTSSTFWSLDALGASSASKALHPLGTLNALLTLRSFERSGCYPGHGQTGQQPGALLLSSCRAAVGCQSAGLDVGHAVALGVGSWR